MNRYGWLGRIAVVIAMTTVASGALQMVLPNLVLQIVGGQASPTALHFFAIVGMFMVLFGGMAWHGVVVSSPPALLWSGLQKLGAVGAVGLGVYHQLFSLVILGVAGFDLLSALVFLLYWRKVVSNA